MNRQNDSITSVVARDLFIPSAVPSSSASASFCFLLIQNMLFL